MFVDDAVRRGESIEIAVARALDWLQRLHTEGHFWSVGGGILVCCFADNVAADDVDALATGIADWIDEQKPADTPALLFRDSAFADDVAKTNMTETLRQRGLENVRSL